MFTFNWDEVSRSASGFDYVKASKISSPFHETSPRFINSDRVRQSATTMGNFSSEAAAFNRPDPFESFLLGPGEKKITSEVDTRMPNTTIFTFNKEDHTLGNLLRARLLANRHVMFSGYKVPHPMFPTFELRVQTDGEITPKEAVIATCTDLVNDLSTLSREFTKEWELRKMVGAGQDSTNGH